MNETDSEEQPLELLAVPLRVGLRIMGEFQVLVVLLRKVQQDGRSLEDAESISIGDGGNATIWVQLQASKHREAQECLSGWHRIFGVLALTFKNQSRFTWLWTSGLGMSASEILILMALENRSSLVRCSTRYQSLTSRTHSRVRHRPPAYHLS